MKQQKPKFDMNFLLDDMDLQIHESPYRFSFTQEKSSLSISYTPTYRFHVIDYVFLVSRPAPYSFFEKALMPFDSEIWYWFIGFVVFGLLVIAAVSFLSQKVQNFVFGLNIRAPMLNLM
jgi:hypothetical protein